MYQTVTFNDFRDAFRAFDRLENFSYAGARLLFDYLDEMDIEFDVIGVCCDYSEDSPDDIALNYQIEGDVLEWLEDHTQVIGVTQSGSIVYCSVF
jgi:hypothetical protein